MNDQQDEPSVRGDAGGGTRRASGPNRRRKPTSRRSSLLAGALELAIIALVATVAWGAKPTKPQPVMPHVNVCHPNVCFLTQQAHDAYACEAGCQWDDPLDAENNTVVEFEATKLKGFENDIPWMYKDSNNFVTIGIGHLISNVHDAELLPFYNKDTGKPATTAEIDAAFSAISSEPPNKPANFYKNVTNLVLHDSDIHSILMKQLQGFTKDLKHWFPDYENYPATARVALLDMAFNPGKKGLVMGWPTLVGATRAYDWETAGDQSARKPTNPARDAKVKQWFEDAHTWEVEALAKQALCGPQPPDLPQPTDPGLPTIGQPPPIRAAAEPATAGSPPAKTKEH